jgi:predicted phage-related endonuclease
MTDTLTDRTTWLKQRRQGIGASDVAAIGQIPGAHGSPTSIWAEKCDLIPIDDRDLPLDDPRSFGLELEPLIAERYERETGLHIRNRQRIAHYPPFPRWFATLDGEIFETEYRPDIDPETDWPLAVFESKYTADPPWDDIPEHYRWQCQWQMLCARHEQAHIAVLHLPFGRPQFRRYEVERDQPLLEHIIATVTAFWNDHVVTGEPPPPDDHPATLRTIDALFGHLETVRLPRLPLDDYRELVNRWAYWRTIRLDAEKHEHTAATSLKAVFGGENPHLSDGTIDGELAVSWRSRRDSRIDVTALRRDHPDLAEKYTNRGTTRMLLPHGKYLK